MKSQTFLKLDGVEGDSSDVRHRGWFDVAAVYEVDSPRDANTGQASGKRTYKPFKIVLNVGPQVVILANSAQSSGVLKGGEIVFVANGIPTRRKILTDVMIQSYSTAKASEDFQQFTVTLNVLAGVRDEWLSPVSASSSSIPGRSAIARRS